MSTASFHAGAERAERDSWTDRIVRNPVRRLTTEPRSAFNTTEFLAFLAVLAGILISAAVVDEANAGGMGAKQAWLYATILTVGYMVSRGPRRPGAASPTTKTARTPSSCVAAGPRARGVRTTDGEAPKDAVLRIASRQKRHTPHTVGRWERCAARAAPLGGSDSRPASAIATAFREVDGGAIHTKARDARRRVHAGTSRLAGIIQHIRGACFLVR